MEALKLFKDMVDASVCPDNFTFASVLAACREHSLFYHGREVHGHLIRSRDDFDVVVSNAIMSMYTSVIRTCLCSCIQSLDGSQLAFLEHTNLCVRQTRPCQGSHRCLLSR